MRRTKFRLIVGLCVICAAVPAWACLWDYDTLAVERSVFPSVLELITGKFLRHSKEFYEWRIADRTKRLAREPDNMALYDDLAVAYHKTGQNDKAIETILQKEKLQSGLYETYSNLGTFYIFTGELEKSVEQIEKAIEINPDAHFGREVYQKLLIEYILAQKAVDAAGKIQLPIWKEPRTGDSLPGGFSQFLANGYKPVTVNEDAWLTPEMRAPALKGVLGMMRFATHDSPILLEALGDLLMSHGGDEVHRGDAKQLAARAYLLASYRADDAKARVAYRDLAEQAIRLQTHGAGSSEDSIGLAELERQFQAELKEADEWSGQVFADEAAWIKAGADVDAEFSKKNYEEPVLSGPVSPRSSFARLFGPPITGLAIFTIVGLILVAAIALVVAIVFAVRASLRRQRLRTAEMPRQAD